MREREKKKMDQVRKDGGKLATKLRQSREVRKRLGMNSFAFPVCKRASLCNLLFGDVAKNNSIQSALLIIYFILLLLFPANHTS